MLLLRTALLCAAAGLALYFGLTAFIGSVPQPQHWLTLAIGGTGLALIAGEVAAALRTGEMHAGRLVVFRRAEQPAAFWLSIGFLAAMGLCLSGVLLLAAGRLAAASA